MNVLPSSSWHVLLMHSYPCTAITLSVNPFPGHYDYEGYMQKIKYYGLFQLQGVHQRTNVPHSQDKDVTLKRDTVYSVRCSVIQTSIVCCSLMMPFKNSKNFKNESADLEQRLSRLLSENILQYGAQLWSTDAREQLKQQRFPNSKTIDQLLFLTIYIERLQLVARQRWGRKGTETNPLRRFHHWNPSWNETGQYLHSTDKFNVFEKRKILSLDKNICIFLRSRCNKKSENFITFWHDWLCK